VNRDNLELIIYPDARFETTVRTLDLESGTNSKSRQLSLTADG